MLKVYDTLFYYNMPDAERNRKIKIQRSWDKRIRNKNCLKVRINQDIYDSPVDIQVIIDWVKKNCKKEVYTDEMYYLYVFKSKQDALLFKLIWG